MAKFFNFYPTTAYTNSNESTSYDIVTNIIARFAFEKSLKDVFNGTTEDTFEFVINHNKLYLDIIFSSI